ncbi:bifunctional 3-(3-hydroxy-phenyl)propionate/3-hydroxycinnamic acid hydroxylase [Sandaracinobacter neustonicus]|uniref:Bifunctional 3-(3-hydroxy-phenyl)propionate/3-hydroxycinnamic acid hydroxylase n=1 Tax=Sandaracinobacter neustonicus TaxID=1715348 RepID=A0A501XD76_9SPHN|nr:bifunctional 3-(3-hydroxy-phenyl)propionate/3-hydroxycinnamic acid hydroxylase [Sandaracinobacter neustonicus]TPE58568.1 bifunctional 3-(3-hydroxy-phenyl)propionate/3-hydroxycinnamic acid hydroxylase [Sandaracinobacter neustonicus]
MTNLTEIETAVLVVGYGPVGAAVACLLGRYGIETIIIDKAEAMSLQPRAIALDNEALRILQMAGLSDDSFPRLAIPYVKMHSPFVGQFGQVNTAGAIDGHPKLVTFAQPDLEAALRKRVDTLATVRVLTGCEATAITETEDGVVTMVRDGQGRATRIRSAYLVGADGATSFVRGVIGQNFTGQTYAEDWLIVDALDVPSPIDHIEFICDPRRPTPHMPAPVGRERWEFMLRPGETREMMESDARVAELLRPWLRPDELKIERRAVYRFHARCCEAFARGRIVLAGDAAHITPPFVGQGLVAGLRDAANLSWKLAAIVKGEALPQILTSYDTERRPHARAMIGLAKFMGGLVMPRSALQAIAAHGLMRGLRGVPMLRRFLDELGVKPQNRFRDGLFVKGRGGGLLVRGAQIPQGWVRLQTGALVRSDEALGSSFCLVGFGVDPGTMLPPDLRRLWSARGYGLVHFCHAGRPCAGPGTFEDVDGTLTPKAAPIGWAAIVRPDRVVLVDGPANTAAELVDAALNLLGDTRTHPARPEDAAVSGRGDVALA